MRKQSIKTKLVLATVSVATAVLLLASFALLGYEYWAFRQTEAEKLVGLADFIASESEAALAFDDAAGAEDSLRSLERISGVWGATLLDLEGKPFASYRRSGAPSIRIGALAESSVPQVLGDSVVLSRLVKAGGKPQGKLVLIGDLSPFKSRVKSLSLILLGVFLVSTLLALFFSNVLGSLITKPVLALTEIMRAVSDHKEYSFRFETKSSDEIGELANGFNLMLEQIQIRDGSLKKHQENLERTVQLRTSELAESVNALKLAMEQAKQGSRAKSRFLANMSHEIRTPLHGITSLLQLLFSSELDGQQRDDLKSIDSCVNSLCMIINDVLDFSKIEEGKLALESCSFSPKGALVSVLSFLEVQAKEKQIALEVTLSDDIPESVIGDSLRLQQILTNLIGNALKFTPQGGHIRVGAELDAITKDEVRLTFAVADDGIGIAPEKQAVIFEAFEQEDDSTTRQYGGTGLGLAICSRLVAMMSGEIGVISEQGRGATFHFTLPFGRSVTKTDLVYRDSPQLSMSNKPLRPVSRNGETLHILLAEDNRLNQETLSRMLVASGYQVTVADNGEEAYQVLCSQTADTPFDIILMDLDMPRMGGIEVTRMIRRNVDPIIANVPVVALTAHAMKGTDQKCLNAGMNAYVAKPVNYEHLLTVMNELTTNPE